MGNKISRKHDVKKSNTIWNCSHDTRVVLNQYRLMGSYRNQITFNRLSSALRKHSMRQEKRRALFEPLAHRRLSKSTTALDDRKPDTCGDECEPSTLAKSNRRRSFSTSDLEDLAKHVEEILQASEEFEDYNDIESGTDEDNHSAVISSQSDISTDLPVQDDETDLKKLSCSTQQTDGATTSLGSFNDDSTKLKSDFEDICPKLSEAPNKRDGIHSAPASTNCNTSPPQNLETLKELNWLQRSGPTLGLSLAGLSSVYNKPCHTQESKDTSTSTTDLTQSDQSPSTPTSDIPRLFHRSDSETQQADEKSYEKLSVKCPVLRGMMDSGLCSPTSTHEKPCFPSTAPYPDKTELNGTESLECTELKYVWDQTDQPATDDQDDTKDNQDDYTSVQNMESKTRTTNHEDPQSTLKANEYQDADLSAVTSQASPVIIKKLVVYNIQDVNKLHHGNTHLYQYHCYHTVGHLMATNTMNLEKASTVTKL